LFHRRDEGAIRQLIDLVRDVIARVLEIPQAGMPGASFEQRFAELGQRFANQGALPLEQPVELALPRNQVQLQVLTTPRLRVSQALEPVLQAQCAKRCDRRSRLEL
jgi:hypothetical protein